MRWARARALEAAGAGILPFTGCISSGSNNLSGPQFPHLGSEYLTRRDIVDFDVCKVLRPVIISV